MARDFLAALRDRVLVADGAMGTVLYSRGIFINRCYDELNLSQPGLIREIHESYARAGAEVIETNTFGANAVRLGQHNLADQMAAINRAGVELAREAAPEAFIAGAVGPLGARIEPLGKISFAEARGYFRAQAEALAAAGADLILLETFGDGAEIQEAIAAAREACNLPVVAQMTIDDDGRALDGTLPEECARRLEAAGADVIGLNCSVGPVNMLEALEAMARTSSLPLAAMPNAGKPRTVDGRALYLVSPEYMADYARQYIQAGAKLVGGCCGTTPEHIKWIRNYVRAGAPGQKVRAARQRAVAPAAAAGSSAGEKAPIPLAERSALGQKLVRGEFVGLVEILPPRGSNAEKELAAAQRLQTAGVDAINIPDGPRASARMSNQALAVMMRQRTGIEPVLHYCCRDRNVISMQSDLLGAYALGLRNVILITGDPPKLGNYPDATAVFDVDAIGLTNLVRNLNRGLDFGGNAVGSQTGFAIGVGANPGAPNFEEEFRRLQWKIEAGADYIVTQPVFDLELLNRLRRALGPAGKPLIAGIWPLASLRQAEFMENELHVAVPEPLRERLRRAPTAEAARREGLEMAKEMIFRLRPPTGADPALAPVAGVQISVLGRTEAACELLQAAREGGERQHAGA
ncbi:MAG: bifunctional homocysteine S-methyltransferase/methylenetetrahydrofolate reductase [Terriglobales bacterium]